MKIHKEPLFHFFLLGVAIFGWFTYLNPEEPEAPGPNAILFDDQDINRLIGRFQAVWQRPPTMDELAGLMDDLVREEILVREARALGMDHGDSVIRNRLVQKMDFLVTSVAQAAEPEDSVLVQHMESFPDRFTRPGKLAFQQIALGENPDPEAVKQTLVSLKGGENPDKFGISSLLPASIPLSHAQQVDGIFGNGFYAALEKLPEGVWAGPVRSGYGFHMVLLEAKEDPKLPPFEDIREDVLFDWRRELMSDLTTARFDELKGKYEVTIPEPGQFAERLSE